MTKKIETEIPINPDKPEEKKEPDLITWLNKNPIKDFVDITKFRENRLYFDSGVPSLNFAMRSTDGAGLPIGVILELIGENKSGKTALEIWLAKETIDHNGIVMLIQNEADLTRERCIGYGIDWDKHKKAGNLIVTQFKLMEDTFEYMFTQLNKIAIHRAKGFKGPITMILDSMAFNCNLVLDQKKFDADDYGRNAKLLGRFASKVSQGILPLSEVLLIIINPLKKDEDIYAKSHKRNTGRAGGKLIGFLCNSQIVIEKIKDWDNGLGYKSKISIQNNKCDSPGKSTELEFFFNTGLIPLSGTYHVLKDNSFWATRKEGIRIAVDKKREYYHEKQISPFAMDGLWNDPVIREWIVKDLKEYYQNKVFKKIKIKEEQENE